MEAGMKIESGLPIASLPPISVNEGSLGGRSAIAVSPDAVAKSSVVPDTQTQSDDQLRQGLDRLNTAAQAANQNITFSVDPETKKIVVKVIDQQTEQVVYQFPADEALKLSASLEQLSGVLFDHKA
jgi:flagellar protein FlaG